MTKHVNIPILLAALVLTVAVFASCGGNRPVSTDSAEVVLHTTSGEVRLMLDGRTPQHRDNFLKLAREGFFDSVLFHRVIAGFMVQAGDPASRQAPAGVPLGMSDGGYTLPAEIVYPALGHTRGALAAARTGDEMNPERRSSGSQFYIVWGRPMTDRELDAAQQRIAASTNGAVVIPDSLRQLYKTVGGTPHLDGQYTVFGHVAEGLDVVDAIQRAQTDPRARPLTDIRILRAEVVREPK
ncbi:peptidylprolyl isomerase [uncultured Alistipes sp.]|jgi:peptidyl-prolyl cis-trans isomerase|uniref:peptidylprolyl isomerase n=1 Tax=uncultured Alistipes sp. TaxID=538949 RepID=UPI0025FE1C90|nr:peptidylprolyl isomerase [uncultured Alistipes sp.]